MTKKFYFKEYDKAINRTQVLASALISIGITMISISVSYSILLIPVPPSHWLISPFFTFFLMYLIGGAFAFLLGLYYINRHFGLKKHSDVAIYLVDSKPTSGPYFVIFVEGSDVRKNEDDTLTPRLETAFSEFVSNLKKEEIPLKSARIITKDGMKECIQY